MTITSDTTITVNSEDDLNNAILAANGAMGASGAPIVITINFGSDITEGTASTTMQQLMAIALQSNVSLVINGQDNFLSGNSAYQGLTVNSGSVTLENLTIEHALAQGSTGTSGGSGGVGGAVLGGGLFVSSTGAVTLQHTSFLDDHAAGGAGGTGTAGTGGTGGAGGGGDIYVQSGGMITLLSGSLSGGAASGGQGGAGSPNGNMGFGFGSGIVAGGDTVIFAPTTATGASIISDVIADDAASGLATAVRVGNAGGAGVVEFAAANTYTGGTEVQSGTLLLTGAGSIADSTAVTVDAAGTLDISLTGGQVTVQQLAGSGTVDVGGANLFVQEAAGGSSFSGSIKDGGLGGGAGGLQIDAGGGALTLSGASTYTGATRVFGALDLSGAGSIADSSKVTLKASGAIFDISQVTSGTIEGGSVGHDVTIGALNGVSGSFVDLGSNTLVVSPTSAFTFAGVIADGGVANTMGGSLVVMGSAPLTLSNTDTYTGVTRVYGELDLASGGSIAGSSKVTLKQSSAVFDVSGAGGTVRIGSLNGVSGSTVKLGAATLSVNQNAVATFAGVIQNSGAVVNGAGGGLTLNGSAALTLSGIETYTGATAIGSTSGGDLVLSGGGSIATSSGVTVIDGGVFDISATAQTTSLTTGATITALAGAGTVDLGAQQLVLSGSGTSSFSGVIQNGPTASGGQLFVQAGTLQLSGVETYTGVTRISGTLDLVGSGSITDSSKLTLKSSGAVFDISGTTGGATVQTLNGVSGSVVDLGAKTLTINENQATTFAGVIQNGGASGGTGGGLTVSGPAILTLNQAETYTGVTTINNGGEVALSGSGSIATSSATTVSGTLDISQTSGATVKALSGAGTVSLGAEKLTVTEGMFGSSTFSGVLQDGGVNTATGGSLEVSSNLSGTLNLTGADTYTGSTTIDGTATLELSGSGSLNSASAVTDNGELLFEYASGSHTFANTVSGSGELDQDGAGTTVTLSGGLSFSGESVIEAGTLALANGVSLASSSSVVFEGAMNSSAVLDLTAESGLVTIHNLTTSSGDHGTVDLGTGGSIVQETSATTFGGDISGAGPVQIGTSGTPGSTLTLSGVNDYTGSTTLYGELALSGSGSITASNLVNLAGSSAVLDIHATTGATISSLQGVSGSVIDLGSALLTVHEYTAGTFSGVIQDGSTGSGGSLTLQGMGLTLAGANTYTGATTIQPGELILTGSIADSSTVQLSGNAIFDISGAAASVSINNLADDAADAANFPGGGTVNLGGASLSVTETASTSFSGVIQDGGVSGGSGGSLVVQAASTADVLTLNATSTFTGGTTLESGTLDLNALQAVGTHAITLAGAATLELEAAALTTTSASGSATTTQTFSNVINGFSHTGSDLIDLHSLAFANTTTVTNSGGTVTVTEGSTSVTLTLTGVNGVAFHAMDDGHGGTEITDGMSSNTVVIQPTLFHLHDASLFHGG